MAEGLRIYDLFTAAPLPPPRPRRGRSNAAWSEILAHAAAMAFNAVCVDLGTRQSRESREAGEPTDAALREFAAAAAGLGLRVIVDLRAADGLRFSDGAAQDGPAAPPRRGGRKLPQPEAAASLQRALHYVDLGVGGFRCIGVDRLPADAWRRLIGDTRAAAPDVVFCAQTLGLSEAAVPSLADAGFDYLFNSVKWWDFQSPWPLEQYERYRRIAPSIGFPEDGGERLVTELLAAGFAESQVEARYRQAYALAAAFSTGLLMPMGFEHGCSRPLDGVLEGVDGGNRGNTGPDDELQPGRFDLVPFIAGTNRMKRAVPALNTEGPQQLLSPLGDPLVALLRHSGRGAEGALTLINTHDWQAREVAVEELIAASGLSYLGDRLALDEMLPGGGERPTAAQLAVAPLEVKVLRASLRPIRPVEIMPWRSAGRDPGHRPEWDPAARILIENVRPEIDGGRFPAKGVVGEQVVVSADLLRDGHDRIAAVLRYAHEDEVEDAQGWQEAPFAFVENDRWEARFRPDRVGRWHYTIVAWTDRFLSWAADFEIKRDAGQDISLEQVEGEWLVRGVLRQVGDQMGDGDAARLREILDEFTRGDIDRRSALLMSQELRVLMARNDERRDRVRYARSLELIVDRPEALFSSWYEMFPRSQGRIPGQSATFEDCIERLGEVAALGFDVVYLVPIHPIGRENRKGRDNAVRAMPDDPGSPYAIGAAEGGHNAVNPELGTLDDFRRFVVAAAGLGIEVALDFAIQCAPDHPWVKEHKRWFEYRPDGSIKHAENPPKKYEDIVNVDFYNPDREGLWRELRDTVLFWVKEGVRIFRVDNPHTKPLPFWEWLIREVKAHAPEAIFLSEAFTRPKMMRALGKAGFSQSYTYFTWRNTKAELTEYLTDLTATEATDYFRPNFFTNTPDILPFFLQEGGWPAFRIRLVLAGTLSPAYGIYNGFELCENEPIPGREEYLHSEKYEYKVWDWDRPGNIKRDIAILNRWRRANPALQQFANLRVLDCPDPNILAYAKRSADGGNIVIVAVNLDPLGLHAGEVGLPLDAWDISPDRDFSVEEAFSGRILSWRGARQFLSLDPQSNPALLFRLLPTDRP